MKEQLIIRKVLQFNILKKQKTLFSVPEEAPLLVYPKWWGKFYASNTDLPQSYTWQQKKYPGYDAEEDELTELCYDYSDGRDGVPYKYDKICNGGEDKAGRIPIREVFINTQVIIEAFEQEINVKKVIEKDFLVKESTTLKEIMDFTEASKHKFEKKNKSKY